MNTDFDFADGEDFATVADEMAMDTDEWMRKMLS